MGCVLGLLALLWGLIGHFRGGAIVLAVSGAHEVDHAAQPQLCNVVEEMAIAAGLPLPKIYLIDDPAPNALAAGRDPTHASVAVTSGLLATLKRQELQGVIAHEMAHVRNYDIRFATLVAVMVGLVAALGGFFLGLSTVGFRAAAALGAAPRRRRGVRVTNPILAPSSAWSSFWWPSSLSAARSSRCSPTRPSVCCRWPSRGAVSTSPTPRPSSSVATPSPWLVPWRRCATGERCVGWCGDRASLHRQSLRQGR